MCIRVHHGVRRDFICCQARSFANHATLAQQLCKSIDTTYDPPSDMQAPHHAHPRPRQIHPHAQRYTHKHGITYHYQKIMRMAHYLCL
ncbi:hypothetical protein BDR07DRAFT_1433170, partial [Suillus spraguei]